MPHSATFLRSSRLGLSQKLRRLVVVARCQCQGLNACCLPLVAALHLWLFLRIPLLLLILLLRFVVEVHRPPSDRCQPREVLPAGILRFLSSES